VSRVALAFEGDSREPAEWSGIPRNFADAFEGLGISVVHTAAQPGRIERGLRRRLGRGGDPAAIAGTAVAKNLRRAGAVDAVLQLGSGFVVPDGPRLATYDDMTVLQARHLDHALLSRLSDAEIDSWAERQRSIYERAEACCVSTRWAAESVIADYGIDAERVHVVGIGRNLDPKPVPRDWSSPRFLFVGQDWRRKNGEGLLRAFREVRGQRPDATLAIVGSHPGVQPEPGVALEGGLFLNQPRQRARMEELFETSTCLVLPSLIEPSAIVHLEAAAAGVPSIGTTVGGVADLLGDSGRLVDPGDHDGLVAAMLELSDPETAERLGDAARERGEWFTWPKIAQRIATLMRL
jgi:glycosyltransferase involved in cell wall biosynthesis